MNLLYERIIYNNVIENPDSIGFVNESYNFTFAQIDKEVLITSTKLQDMGIGKDDKILFIGQNSIDMLILFFSLKYLDAIPVLVNGAVSDDEFAEIVKQANPKYIFTNTIAKGDHFQTLRYWKTDNKLHQHDLHDCLIMHTSGTTGMKLVIITDDNLLLGAQNVLDTRHVTKDDTFYLLIPATFIYGLNMSMGILLTGGTVFIASKLKKLHMPLLKEYNLSILSLTPFLYELFLKILKKSSVKLQPRYISYGGDAMSVSLRIEIEAYFNLPLSNGYGMTETNTISLNDGTLDGVGKLIDTFQIKFLGDGGFNDSEGLIYLTGATIASGYYQDSNIKPIPEWFNTGDYGKMNNGSLILLGRREFMIDGKDPVLLEDKINEKFSIKSFLIQHDDKITVYYIGEVDEDLLVIFVAVLRDNPLINGFLNAKKITNIPRTFNGKLKRSGFNV